MALSEEEIAHASELLTINQRKLRIRDKQIARYGDGDVPDHIVLDAQDIRRKIRALEAILEPELPDEISGLVKRRLEDDYFIFQQVLGAKQDVAILRDEVAVIKQAQSLASEGRMRTEDKIDRIVEKVDSSEEKRASGAPLIRRALLAALIIGALALGIGCVALSIAIRGG